MLFPMCGDFMKMPCAFLPEIRFSIQIWDERILTAERKKKLDCSGAEFLPVEEGLCVQMLHLGPFDDEPASVARMDAYLAEQGYVNDWENGRLHHEIYLSDARRVPPEKWKTVIRHPVRKLT